ncbi:MAG: hypothetical protein IPG50_29895 [Myxococcales bacterium]|nr:hypothetical protein [Myxococcales bacterium]
MPRVLYVSKPIVPPWHDGSKNLVRDVATSLTRHRATVLTSEGVAPPTASTVSWRTAMRRGGRFAPTLRANARRGGGGRVDGAPDLALRLRAQLAVVVGVAHDAGGGRLRGVRRVVQTIASRPKHFRSVGALLFGDVVVSERVDAQAFSRGRRRWPEARCGSAVREAASRCGAGGRRGAS